MGERRLLIWLTGTALLLAAPALGGGDIVWPTYSQASHTTDVQLSCTQLHAEIAHVTADIKLLDAARDRTEESMRTAFDIERYGSTRNFLGPNTAIPDKNNEETFARAREDIIASKKVALARRAFLTNLLAICKEPAAAQP